MFPVRASDQLDSGFFEREIRSASQRLQCSTDARGNDESDAGPVDGGVRYMVENNGGAEQDRLVR
jgi:hypothetical protein